MGAVRPFPPSRHLEEVHMIGFEASTQRLRRIGFAVAAMLLGTAAAHGAQEAPAAPRAPRKLGIVVFPGVQVIDFTGPYEVLSSAHTAQGRLFDVVTVGLSHDEFRAGDPARGIRMLADHSIDDCPKLDVIVVPGGEVGAFDGDEHAMRWLRESAASAECVMSVCNGAFVIAKAGLLKDKPATTFYYFIDQLKDSEPTCTPVHDQRFVDAGNVITTAGLSSGIDGALHLVERYGSRYDAEQCALGLEYHWQPELNWSRGNLADRHYIKMVGAGFDFAQGDASGWRTVENSGTEDRWNKRWTFASSSPREDLLAVFERKFSASWTKAADDASRWTFADERGRAWSAAFALAGEGEGRWTATLKIERQGESTER